MARSILVVDDIAFVRKTMINILTQGQYQVVGEASDGLEAVHQYMKLRPDLVTMDIVMPNLSGIEATRRIMREDKDAKIIIVSAMAHENLIMESINVGARDYIQKPFESVELLRTIERVFSADRTILGQKKASGEKGRG